MLPSALTSAAPDPGAAQPSPIGLTTLARLSAQGGWRVALPHGRETHMFLWVTRGQGRALIDGVRRGLGAGNVLWLPAGTQFSLDIGPQVFGQALSVAGLDAALLPDTARHLRVRDVGFQGEITGLLEMIQRELQAGAPLADAALEAKFALVQVWLRRMMLQVGTPEDRVHLALPEPAPRAHAIATAFARTLERRFTQLRKAEDYAHALDITPTHLARVCAEVTGMSAADLITLRTLHEARRLLEDTTYSAQQISNHLSIGSPAYFSRFMQRHTGLSPSALRKQALPVLT